MRNSLTLILRLLFKRNFVLEASVLFVFRSPRSKREMQSREKVELHTLRFCLIFVRLG